VLRQGRSRSSGGHGADDAGHTRGGLRSHARVLALIRDLERVGDGRGSGPGVGRAYGCGHGGIRLGVLDMLGASM